MVAADGSIVGLEPDLARDVADRLGVGLELVPVTTANRLQRLAQGQLDLVIATLGDTNERRQVADLVQPHYYASGVSLLARADAPYRDWGQLRGRPVCLTDGAYYNRTLGERYLIRPLVFPGTRDTTAGAAATGAASAGPSTTPCWRGCCPSRSGRAGGWRCRRSCARPGRSRSPGARATAPGAASSPTGWRTGTAAGG